jgi:hypothetical protein
MSKYTCFTKLKHLIFWNGGSNRLCTPSSCCRCLVGRFLCWRSALQLKSLASEIWWLMDHGCIIECDWVRPASSMHAAGGPASSLVLEQSCMDRPMWVANRLVCSSGPSIGLNHQSVINQPAVVSIMQQQGPTRHVLVSTSSYHLHPGRCIIGITCTYTQGHVA